MFNVPLGFAAWLSQECSINHLGVFAKFLISLGNYAATLGDAISDDNAVTHSLARMYGSAVSSAIVGYHPNKQRTVGLALNSDYSPRPLERGRGRGLRWPPYLATACARHWPHVCGYRKYV